MPSEKSSCEAASCQRGGSSGTPRHLRSSYRWWITIGNRNACGPCGSCYYGLLWKWHECEGSPSLPELRKEPYASPSRPVQAVLTQTSPEQTGEHTLRQSELLGADSGESILPRISDSFIRKKTLHIKARVYAECKYLSPTKYERLVFKYWYAKKSAGFFPFTPLPSKVKWSCSCRGEAERVSHMTGTIQSSFFL